MSMTNTDIIFQKEKEWRDLLVSQLEKSNAERNKTEIILKETQDKFQRLEMDFKHNLSLLEERDEELNELDRENERMRESNYENEEKISMLSVEIDKLKLELKSAEEVKHHLKEKLQQATNKGFHDVQMVKNDKIKEIERVKDENAVKVKVLERKIIQLEAETRENQYALMADVEETLRSREGELKRKTEQVHSEMLNYELKYRLASKELDLARVSKAEILRNMTEKEEIIRELEMKLGEMELASKSEISIEKMKRETEALHARDKETELLKENDKLSRKLDEKNEAIRNKAELAKRLEGEIKNVLNQGRQKEKEKDLQNEALQIELGRLRNGIKELENTIEKERENLSYKNTEISRIVSRMTEENGKKDGELRNMRLEMDNMVQQLRKKQEDLCELRNELEYAINKDLEFSKIKEGERETWEKKIEKVRIEEMQKVESMIKGITKSRDENIAEVRELRKQLEDRRSVRLCNNCSKESLKNTSEIDYTEKDKIINELTQQSQQLKDVISRMTDETTRQVNEQQQPEVVSNNKHIASLAERNRQLQQEKIELLATSRKLQARLEATESDNSEMKRRVREKDTEISQVKFELDSLQRHTGMDVRTMRRTLQELETELSVSRKEAEEYYKGNLELGRIVEDLQSELTFLKSEKIEKLPTLNFGAQEMLIEQLKKEVSELRSRLVGFHSSSCNEFDDKSNRNDDKEINNLRKKLKAAAHQIKNLASEKQILIQISNRLRSELKLAGLKLPNSVGIGKQNRDLSVDNQENKDIKRTISDLENKLFRLEQLQKNLKSNAKVKQFSSAKDVSSVGRESVDEVFKLLDDSDSLGQSSILDNLQLRNANNVKTENPLLWTKPVKLNSHQTRPKRNMVTNRM